MAKHITVAALAAKRRNELAQGPQHEVRTHLTQCRECAELDEALDRIGKARQHGTKPHRHKTESCLDAETAANYFNGQYSFFRRRKITRHLAACNDCRKLLVELARMASAVLNEEDQALLQALPPFQIEEWAARLASMPSPANYLKSSRPFMLQSLWAGVQSFFAARPLLAYSLAFAAMFLLALEIVWPKVQDWRSAYWAQQGMEALAQENDILDEGLRPAGQFQPRLFSTRRAGEEPAEKNSAEQNFKNSLALNADNAGAKHGQALAAYFAGRLEQAHRALQELHLQNPTDAEIINDLGVVSAALNAPGNALHYFDRALRLKPRFPEARFNRASLLHQLHRHEEARRAWQTYLELNEGSDWQRIAALQKAKLE